MLNIESEIYKLYELYSDCPKETVTKNIELVLGNSEYMRDKKDSYRIDVLMEITGVKKYAIQSWFNKGRPDVKIPFINLLKISLALHISMKTLLADRGDWREKIQNNDDMGIYVDAFINKFFNPRTGWNFRRLYDYFEQEDNNEEQIFKHIKEYLVVVLGVDEDYVNEEINKLGGNVRMRKYFVRKVLGDRSEVLAVKDTREEAHKCWKEISDKADKGDYVIAMMMCETDDGKTPILTKRCDIYDVADMLKKN